MTSNKVRDREIRRNLRRKNFKKTKVLYLFVLLPFIYMFLFNYLPLYGVQIAFKDYRAVDGIFGSRWVGFDHFRTFFSSYQFEQLIRNTLTLSFYSLIAGFPLPILYALFLNYVRSKGLRKSSQLITYAPHFISTVVYCGMIIIFLGNDGIINQVVMRLGGTALPFMSTPTWFKHIYVWSGILQNTGWNSIIDRKSVV